MNSIISESLFEFWTHIGTITGCLTQTEHFTAIFSLRADWPNRVYNVGSNRQSMEKVVELGRAGELPLLVTLPDQLVQHQALGLDLTLVQTNMAADLSTFVHPAESSKADVRRVESDAEADLFAGVASQSFGYSVDSWAVRQLVRRSDKVRLLIGYRDSECAGCGMVFFDSSGNAGLHMIGTLPGARGGGMGRQITQHLMVEAYEAGERYCLLNASQMGEPVYRKLGFVSYGELHTYRVSIDSAR